MNLDKNVYILNEFNFNILSDKHAFTYIKCIATYWDIFWNEFLNKDHFKHIEFYSLFCAGTLDWFYFL